MILATRQFSPKITAKQIFTLPDLSEVFLGKPPGKLPTLLCFYLFVSVQEPNWRRSPGIIQNFSLSTGANEIPILWEKHVDFGHPKDTNSFTHPFENPCGKVDFFVIHNGKVQGNADETDVFSTKPVVFRHSSTPNPQPSHTH